MFSFLLLLAVSTTTHTEVEAGFKVNLETAKCKMQMNLPCNSNEHIKFYLFTKSERRILLDLKNKIVPESYDPEANIKVIIHGYSSLDFMDAVVAGYLKRGKDTLLVVDWEDLASKPCYVSAKMNTRQVGRCTGEALSTLKPIGEIHIVGFSLGAHVAGHVSNYLTSNHGILIDRITGLDPALPLYATSVDEFKLDKSDAKFVDVIHSNPGMFGKAEPSGHVDFYINGASIQPGCYNVSNPPRCSHRRASEVFGESINSVKGFWGVKCPGFFSYLAGFCKQITNTRKRILMGEYANNSSRGIYYVETNKVPPYARGLN
nr:phospholipase A1 member A isoform X1 [Halyomorpha halys]